ncbi:MAG TPA: CAP domain-containing protein [Acidimicrobiales bacterium]|nr:CAP domain-containing protein [Acidimicrobiales bacterium]
MRRLGVLLMLCFLATAFPAVRPAAAEPPDPATAEARFVQKINDLRAGKGLRPLEVHPELVTVARAWAAKMAAADRISHNPNLTTEVTADWQKLGENVGVGMTVDALHDAFVASPAHYRNLVDADFAYIGVGVVIGRDGAIFTAHEFMQLRPAARPRVSGPAPAAAPAAAPAEAAAPAPPPPPVRPRPAPSPRMVLVLEQLRALDIDGGGVAA